MTPDGRLPPPTAPGIIDDAPTTGAGTSDTEVEPADLPQTSRWAKAIENIIWMPVAGALYVIVRSLAYGMCRPSDQANMVSALSLIVAVLLIHFWLGDGPRPLRWSDPKLSIAIAFGVVAMASFVVGIAVEPQDRPVRKVQIGNAPQDLAATADGLWITDPGAGAVRRLDEDTRTEQASIPLAGAFEIVADQSAVWVTRARPGGLTKLDHTGRVVGSIDFDSTPGDIALGSSGVWLTFVDRLGRVDAATLDVTWFAVGVRPASLVVGDRFVWVTDIGGKPAVMKVDASDGSVLDRIDVSGEPLGIFQADGSVWVSTVGNGGAARIVQIDATTDSVVREYRPPGVGAPTDLLLEDDRLWVVGRDASNVLVLDAVTQELVWSREFPGGAPVKIEPTSSNIAVSDPDGGSVHLIPRSVAGDDC